MYREIDRYIHTYTYTYTYTVCEYIYIYIYMYIGLAERLQSPAAAAAALRVADEGVRHAEFEFRVGIRIRLLISTVVYSDGEARIRNVLLPQM